MDEKICTLVSDKIFATLVRSLCWHIIPKPKKTEYELTSKRWQHSYQVETVKL